MNEKLIPRPAATVLTLRDRPTGFEVLMLRRNLKSEFVGGAHVFPGGAVDEGDGDPDMRQYVLGLDDEQASTRLALASGGLAYYVACLRELFEEAGLLIACGANAEPVDLGDPAVMRRMAAHRRGLNDGSLTLLEVLRSEDLVLDVRGLAYLAHWVTPAGPPRRYDTRFFVVLAPGDQRAAHDDGETIEEHWLRPKDALMAHQEGDFTMILPTIRNLQAVSHFDTSREVLDYACALTDIVCVEPRMVTRGGEAVILLPGDEGFDD
jgi:8-oxo-dGTP pyrophosphatase MutT (NUDIX family)